ncbi:MULTISPECIES: hypothetical protein [unclassified Sphingomonas]|jgi:hypothetical protein|uniref:hypothetical protein n=1 Tax=unclassified Sphingomonas TaxID=196159 RepID=UPI001FD4E971|nr:MULTISPECIES: hypothetical protein [unclassified Sphingomonas]
MAKRFWLGLRQLLVAVDQLAYILIAVPIYVVAGGPTPSADETISSRVGRAAIKGHRWGAFPRSDHRPPLRPHRRGARTLPAQCRNRLPGLRAQTLRDHTMKNASNAAVPVAGRDDA